MAWLGAQERHSMAWAFCLLMWGWEPPASSCPSSLGVHQQLPMQACGHAGMHVHASTHAPTWDGEHNASPTKHTIPMHPFPTHNFCQSSLPHSPGLRKLSRAYR